MCLMLIKEQGFRNHINLKLLICVKSVVSPGDYTDFYFQTFRSQIKLFVLYLTIVLPKRVKIYYN